MQMLENFNYEKQTNNYGIQTKTKQNTRNKTKATQERRLVLRYV